MIASQRLFDTCFQALVAISQAFIAVVAGVGGRFRLMVVTHRDKVGVFSWCPPFIAS